MECLSSRREREAPGGRARENRKFIQAPLPEIWSETIFGGEEGLAGRWGGFRLEAREASGSETARVHNVAWWCGGVAARGAGGAARARATDSPARFEALEFGPVAPRLPRRRACRRCCAR